MEAQENNFKKIGEKKSAPPNLKDEVMGTIDILKYVVDVVDLFTVKQLNTNTQILSNLYQEDKTEKK